MTGNIHLAALSRPTIAEQAMVWLLRLAACGCLALGIVYWGRIVGYPAPAQLRFDTMPSHWQAASATLAVLFPFAAIGLWMLASWGPVIWTIAVAAEAVMYAGFPHLFGENRLVLAGHAAVAAFYLVCRLVIFLQKRAPAVSRH